MEGGGDPNLSTRHVIHCSWCIWYQSPLPISLEFKAPGGEAAYFTHPKDTETFQHNMWGDNNLSLEKRGTCKKTSVPPDVRVGP